MGFFSFCSQIDLQELRHFLATSPKYQAMRNIDPKLFNHSQVGFRLLNSFLYEVGNYIAQSCPDTHPSMTAKNYFQVFFDRFWLLLTEFVKLQENGVKIYDGRNTHSIKSYVRCVAQRRFTLGCKRFYKSFLPAEQKSLFHLL